MIQPIHLSKVEIRRAAAELVDKALASKAPIDRLLDSAVGERADRDRALLHTIVYGTLRWLRRIDHVIESASRREVVKIERKLRAPLRVAVYQLLYLDRVPSHAIVHEAVAEARRRTHKGGGSFTNAVLRKIAVRRSLDDWPIEGELAEKLSIETSYPQFLVERWLARWGRDTTRTILDAGNRQKPTHLLAFSDRGGAESLANELGEAGIRTTPSEISPHGLIVNFGDPLVTEAFREGRAYVQDEAAQVAALVPLPVAGERIFDAAASPGGKSFALLAAEPSVQLVAADRDLRRLHRFRQNTARLGRTIPHLAASAIRPPFGETFDRVVVDYPCTGTGTFRKHPELKWRVSPKEITRLADQTLRFALSVAPLVKPGGLLLGISCSIEPEENEGWVEKFVEENSEFELAEFETEQLLPSARPYWVSPGLWQLPPGDDHDGLTVNALRRSA